MLRIKAKNLICGITLIEVTITLLISLILIAVVTPTFTGWLKNIQIRSTAETLRAAIKNARAEAIKRNSSVRFNLTDSNGVPSWSITCVRISRNCKNELKVNNAKSNSDVRVGIAKNQNMPPINMPIKHGTLLPSKITFGSRGTAPNIINHEDISRIDITHISDQNVQRLVLLISPSGLIKLCNPKAQPPDSQAC